MNVCLLVSACLLVCTLKDDKKRCILLSDIHCFLSDLAKSMLVGSRGCVRGVGKSVSMPL